MQKTHREINDYIIEEVLRTGTAEISAADLKIIKTVAASIYVRDIFRRLQGAGYDETEAHERAGGRCLIRISTSLMQDRRRYSLKIFVLPPKAMSRTEISYRQVNAYEYLQNDSAF